MPHPHLKIHTGLHKMKKLPKKLSRDIKYSTKHFKGFPEGSQRRNMKGKILNMLEGDITPKGKKKKSCKCKAPKAKKAKSKFSFDF
tara:strand:+ start:820 stop:1077 length:258 start_codon:yes stop_codon:yes gene_type:complete